MRELKFRAWDGEKMVYPQDICGDVRGELLISLAGSVFLFRESSNGGFCPSTIEWSEKPTINIQQFTGLNENAYEDPSQNKGIYEGDIIEFILGQRAVVEWNDDTCQWQFSDGTPLNDGDRYNTHKMIVGNIYENPELINK